MGTAIRIRANRKNIVNNCRNSHHSRLGNRTILISCLLILVIYIKLLGQSALIAFSHSSSKLDLTDRIVNPYNFTFTLLTSECSPRHQLLIVVHSSTKPEYNIRRTTMRSTWLKTSYLNEKLGLQTKIVFFMGLADNSVNQRRIEYESEMYNDIVQSDFIDCYENNTYKAMSFMLWTSKYCSNAKLLLKIDDDALLRMSTLPALRRKMEVWAKSLTPLYIGKQTGVVIPDRNPNSKWYVSRELWPDDEYPTWLQGMVYILSPSNTGLLFEAAQRTGYMHTDDVFVGICVHKTSVPGQYIESYNDISWYAEPGEGEELRLYWNWARIPFLHIPDNRIYLKWHYEEVCADHLDTIDLIDCGSEANKLTALFNIFASFVPRWLAP